MIKRANKPAKLLVDSNEFDYIIFMNDCKGTWNETEIALHLRKLFPLTYQNDKSSIETFNVTIGSYSIPINEASNNALLLNVRTRKSGDAMIKRDEIEKLKEAMRLTAPQLFRKDILVIRSKHTSQEELEKYCFKYLAGNCVTIT